MNNSVYDPFFARALESLKTTGFASSKDNDIYSKDVMRAFDVWGGFPKLSSYDDMTEAAKAFDVWSLSWDGQYPLVAIPVLLQMTLTAPLGKGTISMSLHGQLPQHSTQEEINAASVQLWDMIQQGYKHLADRRGANGVNPRADVFEHHTAPLPETVQSNNKTAPNMVLVPLTKLSVEIKEGKSYWRAHGGQWEKFGVYIWPEVLNKAGIKHEGRTKGFEFKGDHKAEMWVETKTEDGKTKPVKVTEIVKASK